MYSLLCVLGGKKRVAEVVQTLGTKGTERGERTSAQWKGRSAWRSQEGPMEEMTWVGTLLLVALFLTSAASCPLTAHASMG